MQPRNTQGKFKRKPKGIFALVIIMTLIGVTLYYAGDKDAVETTVEPVGDLVAQEDERYKEYMNREEVKKAMELNAKIAVVEEDKSEENKLNLQNTARIEEEYKTALNAEKKRNAVKMFNLNGKLDSLQKEKLNLVASSSKTSFKNTQIVALRDFLKNRNPEMAKYAHLIVELPRYMEVVSITGQESSWCTSNMAKTKNNCGGVKNKNAQGFKVYPNVYESLKDMAMLLERPMYKDKTIDEWNGVYCVWEEHPTGKGKCPNWTENITSNVIEIRQELLSRI